ncbi:MAG: hypothetical protein B6244_06365 [Candidatus Cloacimonetes bacterium 4572_55]|nr:MAG: hypothetical protein B6244_06365 [Candidatus Cloacimonetes bacterium 4572_55]
MAKKTLLIHPMSHIFWTGVKMSLPVSLIAVFYVYYTTRLSFNQANPLIIFTLGCFVVDYIFKWIVQLKLTPRIRGFCAGLKKGKKLGAKQLQDVWVETLNLPVKIVVFTTSILGIVWIVLPVTLYSSNLFKEQDVWLHVLIGGFISIMVLSVINLLLYEQTLISLLLKIEEIGRDQLNRNDPRISFFSIQFKFVTFFGMIIIVCVTILSSLTYQKVNELARLDMSREAALSQLQTHIFFVSAILLVTATALVWILAAHQMRPIGRIKSHMTQLLNGEIGQTFSWSIAGVVRDEGNLLAEIFSEMVNELQKALAQIRQSGIDLKKETSQISVQAHSYLEHILDQSQTVASLKASVGELSSPNLRISKDADQVLEVMDATIEDVCIGRDMIQKVVEGVDILQVEARATQAQVETLRTKLVEVSEIVTIIRKVTNQTQILAFNALLETADGELTHRYDYIASSINKLTLKIAEDSKQIRNTVQEVQHYSQTIFTLADREFSLIRNEALSINHFHVFLDKISRIVNAMNDEVKQITESTQWQGEVRRNIVRSLEDIRDTIDKHEEESSKIIQQIERLQNHVQTLGNILSSFYLKSDKGQK